MFQSEDDFVRHAVTSMTGRKVRHALQRPNNRIQRRPRSINSCAFNYSRGPLMRSVMNKLAALNCNIRVQSRKRRVQNRKRRVQSRKRRVQNCNCQAQRRNDAALSRNDRIQSRNDAVPKCKCRVQRCNNAILKCNDAVLKCKRRDLEAQ